MRIPALVVFAVVVSACLAAVAGAAEPSTGTLVVERGRGSVLLDIRGSMLGRLKGGILRVTDYTPRDAYSETVVGRRLTAEQVAPRTTLYRGLGLRFRMLGGGYRVLVRGFGIDLSVVGHGVVVLDGDSKFPGDDVGVYSLDEVDCGLEPLVCEPLPDDPERFELGVSPSDTPARSVAS